MPYAYLCDFDGTVSPSDIGAALVRRFSTGDSAAHQRLLDRWFAGGIGHRELTEAQCADVRVAEAEALEFTRSFRIDEHFAAFAREALGRGDAVMVVSEGFDLYVRDQLQRAGLGELPYAANRLRFEGGRAVPEFPYLVGGCGQCGNCKAQHVRRYRALGYHTVLVGDGLSDRCGARAAETVLAHRGLLEWCRRERLAAVPFETFADIADWARRRPAGVPPRG